MGGDRENISASSQKNNDTKWGPRPHLAEIAKGFRPQFSAAVVMGGRAAGNEGRHTKKFDSWEAAARSMKKRGDANTRGDSAHTREGEPSR